MPDPTLSLAEAVREIEALPMETIMFHNHGATVVERVEVCCILARVEPAVPVSKLTAALFPQSVRCRVELERLKKALLALIAEAPDAAS